jgi:sucrose-6-phosphate hydrolase SacC (GH32 family)
LLEDGKVSLRLVLDRTSLEIFANDGASQIAKCFVPEDKNDAPIVELSPAVVPNGAANVRRNVKLEVYPLRSVWNVEK